MTYPESPSDTPKIRIEVVTSLAQSDRFGVVERQGLKGGVTGLILDVGEVSPQRP